MVCIAKLCILYADSDCSVRIFTNNVWDIIECQPIYSSHPGCTYIASVLPVVHLRKMLWHNRIQLVLRFHLHATMVGNKTVETHLDLILKKMLSRLCSQRFVRDAILPDDCYRTVVRLPVYLNLERIKADPVPGRSNTDLVTTLWMIFVVFVFFKLTTFNARTA